MLLCTMSNMIHVTVAEYMTDIMRAPEADCLQESDTLPVKEVQFSYGSRKRAGT